MEIPIEGRRVPTKLTAIRLAASGCGEQPIVVAVDDQLVGRADVGPDGKSIDVILGHDYLEAERAGIRYMERGDEVACHVAPLTQVTSSLRAKGPRPGKVVKRSRRGRGK